MEFTNDLSRRTEDCFNLFQSSLGPEKLADDDWFEDRAVDFLWWSHGLKAQKTGRSSLDYRVKDRPDIQRVVAGLLDTLAIALKRYLHFDQESFLGDGDGNFSESDKSSCDSSWCELSDEENVSRGKNDAVDDPKATVPDPKFYIETSLKMLASISIAIKRSGTKLRYLKADEHLSAHSDDDEYLQLRKHLLFIILVGPYERSLFAEMERRVINKQISIAVEIVVRSWIVDPSRATTIQQRLIEANIIRRNRIIFARRSITKRDIRVRKQDTPAPALISSKPSIRLRTDKEPTIVGANAQEAIASPIPQQLEYGDPKLAKAVTAETQTATELGSQLVLTTMPFEPKKRTLSIATRMTQTGTKQDYPACPTGKGSFQCPYCVQVLTQDYTKKSRWRGHVAQDLNPYSCIYQACPDSHHLFATKEEWAKHTTACHNSERWVCDECIMQSGQDEEFIFDSCDLWEGHMKSQHNCSDNRLILLRNMSKRALTETSGCPLCKRPGKGSRPDQDDHIAEHLHAWALRALPWDLNPDDKVSRDSAEMGSADDLARTSQMSERAEEGVDEEEENLRDAVDREVNHWRSKQVIVSDEIVKLTKTLDEGINKWNARRRLEAQNESLLRHLTRINQTRDQLSHVLGEKSDDNQSAARQQKEIDANLVTQMELGIEYINEELFAEGMADEEDSYYSALPKFEGNNIPPTDAEKEEILWERYRRILSSSNVTTKLSWARDVLIWVEGSQRSLQDDRFDTPPRQQELRVYALNVMLDPDVRGEPEALYTFSRWLQFGKFSFHIDKSKAFAGYKRAAELGHARSEYGLGSLHEQSGEMFRAKQHYHRGMSLQDSACLYRMGMMTLLGEYGETRDYSLALKRLKASADTSDEDSPEGPYVYGMLIAGDLPGITIPEGLLPRDLSIAKMYVEKSAYLGLAKAQLKMGHAYLLGQLGCDPHDRLSHHYYSLAARQGLSEADTGASIWFLLLGKKSLGLKYAKRALTTPRTQETLGYFYDT